LFIASRLLIVPFSQPASDVLVYAKYGREAAKAAQLGLPLADYHRGVIERQILEAGNQGLPAERMADYKSIEYPPLAIQFVRLPILLMGRAAADASDNEFDLLYVRTYRGLMAAADCIIFLLLILATVRGDSFLSTGSWPLVSYTCCTLAVWVLLYDRLDLMLGLLILAAWLLLRSCRHYSLSFAFLALAINFKLVPIVLGPVWLLGSLPAGEVLQLNRFRIWRLVAIRALLLLGLIAIFFLPFYLASGPAALDFLTYHLARGIEIGSTYGSILMLLSFFGVQVNVSYSFGSLTLTSPLASVLAAAAPWMALAVLGGASAKLLVDLRRITAQKDTDRRLEQGTLAQRYPLFFLAYTAFFLVLFIGTSKVFSPQYLLWLIPLLVLIPPHSRPGRLLHGTLFLLCLVSTLLMPILFYTDLIATKGPMSPAFWSFHAPGLRFTAFSCVRNGLLVCLAGWIAVLIQHVSAMNILGRQQA
jgi:hypothetical protein